MASLRKLKKDIDYLIQEFVADCYLTTYFHPEKEEEVNAIIKKAAELGNNLYERANNPVEKNNRHLVRKHYRQIRIDMLEGFDEVFSELSAVNK